MSQHLFFESMDYIEIDFTPESISIERKWLLFRKNHSPVCGLMTFEALLLTNLHCKINSNSWPKFIIPMGYYILWGKLRKILRNTEGFLVDIIIWKNIMQLTLFNDVTQ